MYLTDSSKQRQSWHPLFQNPQFDITLVPVLLFPRLRRAPLSLSTNSSRSLHSRNGSRAVTGVHRRHLQRRRLWVVVHPDQCIELLLAPVFDGLFAIISDCLT